MTSVTGPKKVMDISFLLGVFSSSIIIWFYFYNLIIDITTQKPAEISLLYLAACHFISFLCSFFSFILLLNYSLEISLESHEIRALKQFQVISSIAQRALFTLWGPMFIFGFTAIASRKLFANSGIKFLAEFEGFFFATILSICIYKYFLKINLILLVKIIKPFNYILALPAFFIYIAFLSLYSSGVRHSVEKEFYKTDEIARFQVSREGYIFLPRIKRVSYNFASNLEENFDQTYYVDLSKYNNDKMSIIEIKYESQIFGITENDYFHINKSPK